ncbi:MAG: 2,3,4,5-tetrahydropyridine-2,6-dicarboxylate N-succinyltransferase [Pyrinomonadaceae bacterium]
MSLRERIELLCSKPSSEIEADDYSLFEEFRAALTKGEIRAAEKDPLTGNWQVNSWVKNGILTGFRIGILVDFSENNTFRFFDKDTFPVRAFKLEDNIRIVPGGSSIRDGAFIAPGVICMPPMYVNVGAYVDGGTMIDSHALVGSCAQIGKRVHLSAAAQIGGVIEPIGAMPVIIEDDVLVGGGCGVYEGAIVREKAVLAPGVILTGSTPVFDLARERVYRRSEDGLLEIPAGAVVVPGSRAVNSKIGKEWGISLFAPVIVKYRDEKTDHAVQLEDFLR